MEYSKLQNIFLSVLYVLKSENVLERIGCKNSYDTSFTSQICFRNGLWELSGLIHIRWEEWISRYLRYETASKFLWKRNAAVFGLFKVKLDESRSKT